MFKKGYSLFFVAITVLFFASNVQAILVEGGSDGIFVNPTGPSGMLAYGMGTNHFSWVNDSYWNIGKSWLNFEGNPFSEETGNVFSFGTLGYFNGTILAGTQADAVDLSVKLTFTTPSGIEEDFAYNLGLINTVNTGDPVASADIVYLPGSIPDSYFTIGSIDYTLEFLGFGNPTVSGFTTVDKFHVLEGRYASAQLFGCITADFTHDPIPEPATMLLFGTGLVGLIGGKIKKKKK